MKKIFIYSLLFLVSLTIGAQTSNTLSIPDINTPLGQAQLPVSLSNTDEIVAIQFDLTLPDGITASETVALTNRADGHTATARNMGGGIYRVLLFAQPSKALLGESGTVMNIPITVPDSYAEGSVHQLAISNAILTDKTGANVLTQAAAGSITVSRLPDLTIRSITANKSTLSPEDRMTVSWQVENIGDMATNGGWNEHLSLVDKDGTVKLIATEYYDQPLSAKSVVSRQTEITLPKLLGIDGNVYVQVKVVPDNNTGESASAQGNNTMTSDDALYINKVLTLEASKLVIEEGSDTRLMAKLSRSGNWSRAETFNLTATADSRIIVPATVTIPAKQSGTVFYIELKDDDIVNESSEIMISAEGNGYPATQQTLTIEDNEYPDLTVTASKSVVEEGETFQLTITTSHLSAEPIVVTLNCENPKRFNYPSLVTIPAGERSVTAQVEAVDDNLPSLELSSVFTASATRHNKGEVVVLLKDNDMPVLELTLTPEQVSEGAGVISVTGTLRRLTNKDSRITVKLTDDAEGGLYFGNRTLELDKGVEKAYFNFGPVDNAMVDGDRTYTITASVWLASCSCSALGESAGSVSAPLQVLDNDGPALKLTSSLSTIKEGGKTVLTITRNTSTEQPLTVTLSSDNDETLSYTHTATIPAGEQLVQVEVTSASNDVQGDSHTIIFTVQAEGYSTGTCYVMVTDQTLPDAVAKNISLSETEIEATASTEVSVTIANEGFDVLPTGTEVSIRMEGQRNALYTGSLDAPLSPGSSVALTQHLTLPDMTGKRMIYATVNDSRKVNELRYDNNSSESVAITLLPRFTASVVTDKPLGRAGEPITISGKATGSAAANSEVEIYLINDGLRQTITATTDAQGEFTAEWTPFSGQMGHFTVGACYPGEHLTAEQASVDVVGLKRVTDSYITCQVAVGETFSKGIEIRNPGRIPQTLNNVEILSKPENCEITFEQPAMIDADGKAMVRCKIVGSEPSKSNEWEFIRLRMSTQEGAILNMSIYYFCYSPTAKLVSNISEINTTMVKGQSRDYPIVITNEGMSETGTITLSLPNVTWMKSVTPAQMPSLAYHESATIILRLTPDADMPLNVAKKGIIGVNSESGRGLPINYTIVPVSEQTGILTVDVVDEYSSVEGGPHVAGATVRVKNVTTGSVLETGTTGENGKCSFELAEGYYNIEVTAPNHDSYTNNVLVDPGRELTHLAFLSFNAISYTWTVEETEIEDVYEIKTTVTYETNVPKPVLLISLPENKPAPNEIFPIVVTNKGLINALDVNITSHISDGYGFEILNRETLPELTPQQSHVFYGVIKSNVTDWENVCIQAYVVVNASYECYGLRQLREEAWLFNCRKQSQQSQPSGSGGGGGSAGPGSPVGGGSGGWVGGSSNSSYTPWTSVSCESCPARVRLEVEQIMTMKRPAYRGTLEVYNGHEDTPMTDVKLNLNVKDDEGNVADDTKFAITLESLEGFSGEKSLEGGWTLGAGQTGKATVLFIPTKNAAPDGDKDYYFGGTFDCIDPFLGDKVVRELVPVTLTVRPLPELELTYFMQRDIYGDDPLTPEVEPSKPAEFALLINNKGNGNAKDVRIFTKQPQIEVNSKGLDADFKLVSSQVNGESAMLGLSETVESQFGTIFAHSQAYAQWWLESSLLGHFTSYEVEVTHVTNYGNKNLSLIDKATIHELIHGFTLKRQDGSLMRGFLVNDIADEEDLPDQVYFTDATQQTVSLSSELSVSKAGDNCYYLMASASQAGWNYGSVKDPTQGKQELIAVVRQSDGAELPVDNFWQTDRTLPDGKEWLYENRLHFVGEMPVTGETYILTFGPRPGTELVVKTIEGVPEEGVIGEMVSTLTVKFNKPIDETTFTIDDVTLTCEDEVLDISSATITPIDNTTFVLNLGDITQADGYYVLTVHTKGITGMDGYNGTTGKSVSWVQIDNTSVGIAQQSADDLIVRISPIPLGDWMTFEGNFNEIRRVEVVDMRGINMLQGRNLQRGQSLDCSRLSAGVYHVTVETERGKYLAKVLKR